MCACVYVCMYVCKNQYLTRALLIFAMKPGAYALRTHRIVTSRAAIAIIGAAAATTTAT